MAVLGFDGKRINRYFKGIYSDPSFVDEVDDASYVAEVFCDNNREKDLEHLLLSQFNELPEDEMCKKNLDHILFKIHYDINTGLSDQKTGTFENLIKWSFRIAGIIMLPIVIMIGFQMNKETNLKNETWIEIKAPAWTRAQFSLPDGTIGWLNSNSTVKYNGNFSTNRIVKLTGEAFFDVAKDTKRPFMVNTNEVDVKVLGTRFNLASYDNERHVEVVLEEGSLIFSEKKMNMSYSMKPNDMVIYDKKSNEFTAKEVEPQKYTSWTEGKLVFRNDPLDVIARRLERWYNIDIEVKGHIDRDPRLRATFIDETLEEVLSLLNRSLAIDYRIENRSLKPDEVFAKKKVFITVKPKKH